VKLRGLLRKHIPNSAEMETDLAHIAFILDDSGFMESIAKDGHCGFIGLTEKLINRPH